MILTQEVLQIVAQTEEVITQMPHLCFLEIVAQQLTELTLHLPTVEKVAHLLVLITLTVILILEENTAALLLLIATTLIQDRVVQVLQAVVAVAAEVMAEVVEVAEEEVDKTLIYSIKL